MAYHNRGMSATFVPGGMDDFYVHPAAPVLVAPEPQRINPEMSNQIAGGIEAVQNLSLNSDRQRASSLGPAKRSHQYSDIPNSNDAPHLSPFPKLLNPPPNVPPSDEDLEATLENARTLVLNSNDPEMQLAWASDALVYVGVCADDEERMAAAKPQQARPATPRVEHQLKIDAMNIVTFLADQHHPKAEFLRGMWLEWGRFGQREDKKEAFRCYSRAADRGYARAEYRIGMLYESYNDPVKALRHYHKGVDAGDSASCYRLGMMTLRGQHGQQQDYSLAIDLIRRSANGADENAAQGAYVYGMLLARQLPQIDLSDDVLPFDERQARINIEKAAYLKFAKAQLKMGSAYELGSLGCEFNPALSVHYNALASKQGEADADMAISKWFLVGSEGLFPKNEELAFTYAERAAQSGLATAEFALGYFNEIGMYVPVNLDKAMEWYQKASKHGNSDAAGRIDGITRKQVLSKKDHENVAINRIKSQHGSMRGVRPDRFQQRQQQGSRLAQSTTVEEVTPQAYSNGGAMQPPARGTTPYPEDDRPAKVPPIDNRSTTPYPLDDGPPRLQPRLGPTGGFFNPQQQPQRPSTTLNPDVRPSSAFQLSPDLRSNSVGAGPQPHPPYAGRPPYVGGPLAPQGPRPATTQLYDQSGRPSTTQPYDPRLRPNPGQRVASGPSALQSLPSQQGIPPPAPRPGNLQHQSTAPPAPQGQALDIGFSAPPDNRRNRTAYTPGPASRPPQAGAPQKPSLQSTDSMPNFDNPAGGRMSNPASRPGSRPPDGRAPDSGISRPPRTDSAPAPKPVTHTSTAPPASKPGKGPKTFDEMGVPAQKNDGECTIM